MSETSCLNFRIPADQLRYWLALLHAPGLNLTTFIRLVENYPNLAELFALPAEQLAAQGLTQEICDYFKNPDWSVIEKGLAWSEQSGHHIITWKDPTYPILLREISAAPPLLFIAGDPQLLTTPQLAIVGSRNPTPQGIEHAQQFAGVLAAQGITITSGLALGIDGAAHRGALEVRGKTIAVVGTGLDQIYPARHSALAQKIIEQGGAIVSEFPLGTSAKAGNFPRRNRIISGLSMGTLVIEAALQSGSLITARYANEQGREVFAIPGSIHNPLARGCHALIRQGAKLVENVNDILEELTAVSSLLKPLNAISNEPISSIIPLDNSYAELVKCLGYEATSIDQLIERSGLTADRVSSMLLQLELQGQVAIVPGGYQRITRT